MVVQTRRQSKKERSLRTTAARQAQLSSIAKKQKDLCWYCNEPMGYDCSREHLQARARGGTDEAKNIRATHSDCNSAAGHLSVKKKYELRRIGHAAGRSALLEAAHRMRRHESYQAFSRRLEEPKTYEAVDVDGRTELILMAVTKAEKMRRRLQAEQESENARIKREARAHYWAKLGLLGKPDWWDG